MSPVCEHAIFRLLLHCSHISAKCTCHVFFSAQIGIFDGSVNYYLCCYCPFLLGFVTSTICLPTEWHHLCVTGPLWNEMA